MLAALACAVPLAACGSSNSSGSTSGGGGGASTSGGGGSSTSSEPIKVGSIADVTGPTAAVQTPFLHGIQAYFKMTNDAGGVNGRQIDLTNEDEKYDVQAGLSGYKKLVNQDDVVALVGALNNSSFQTAALKLITRDKVPVVGAESTTKEALTPFNPYFFAMECSYADQADVMVPYMAKKTGVEAPKVAVVSLDVASGYEFAGLIKERVQKAGGTFLGHYTLPPTATEADAQIQKIAGQKPDFIAVHGSSQTSTIVLKSMAKFGMTDTPVIGIFATGSDAVYQAVPKSVGQNFETVNCYTPPDVSEPGMAEAVDAGKKAGFSDDVNNVNYINGWVVGEAFVAGLKNIDGDVTRDSVLKGMEGVTDLDTQGLSGNVTFGPDDRAGVQVVRPYAYDYAKKKTVAVGDYAEYAQYLSNEYLPKGGS